MNKLALIAGVNSGMQDEHLFHHVFAADLAAFGGQFPRLATRYAK